MRRNRAVVAYNGADGPLMGTSLGED